MSLVAVVSAKCSPGASTFAEILVALWPTGRHCLLADCDPAGGEWLLRPGVATEPGLMTLAAQARRDLTGNLVLEHIQVVGEGFAAVVGAASSRQSSAALEVLAGRLGPHLRSLDGVDAVADCGRLALGSPSLPLVRAADLVVLVSRSTIAEIVHLASWVDQLRSEACPVAVVLTRRGQPPGGQATYRPEEVGDALGVDVLGVLADDPRAVSRLFEQPGSLRGLGRSRLVRSAGPVVAAVATRAVSPDEHPQARTVEVLEPSVLGLAETSR